MATALVEDYRLARAAQDARFDSRRGAGAVDHSLDATEEYAAYFGLGEYMGVGVERRITFKSFLIARAAERRAEREAADAATLAELPTHFLVELTSPAIDAELERRLAEFDADHEHEAAVELVEADVVALAVEVIEAAVAVTVEAAAPAAVANLKGSHHDNTRHTARRAALRMVRALRPPRHRHDAAPDPRPGADLRPVPRQGRRAQGRPMTAASALDDAHRCDLGHRVCSSCQGCACSDAPARVDREGRVLCPACRAVDNHRRPGAR